MKGMVTLLKSMNMVTQKWNVGLFASIKDKCISILKSEIIEIQENVRKRYLNNEFKELKSYLVGNKRFISAFKTTLDTEDEKIAYEMGRLSGFLSVYEEFLDERAETDACMKYFSKTKYSKEILEKLSNTDYMSHNQLARALSIQPCQLTSTMTQLEKHNQHMIAFSKIGKYKYYYLTEIGKKYIRYRNKDGIADRIVELIKKISVRMRGECADASLHDFIKVNYGDSKELKNAADCLLQNINTLETENHIYNTIQSTYQSILLYNFDKQKNTLGKTNISNSVIIMPHNNLYVADSVRH